MRKLQFAACHPERRTVGSKSIYDTWQLVALVELGSKEQDLLWILAFAFTFHIDDGTNYRIIALVFFKFVHIGNFIR